MANFSIGTAGQYDALSLLPAIDTTNGGIIFETPKQANLGSEWSANLKFKEVQYAGDYRTIIDNSGGTQFKLQINPNIGIIYSYGCNANTNTVSTQTTKYIATCTNDGSNITFLFNRSSFYYARCVAGDISIKDPNGDAVWKWLDQVSDYKSTPPSSAIFGTLAWYKLATDGNEINNYLTGTLLHNALTGATQTEPIVVYVLDASTDVSMIQSSYNGQPVTIDSSFLPKGRKKIFWRGFGFRA